MIVLKDVTKRFDEKLIMDGISLEVNEGERVAVIGPSGCGKSTTLRLILGLHKVDSGSIKVDGEEITNLNTKGLSRIRMKFGMVFQSSALFDSMTVGKNVGFALKQHSNLNDREIRRIAQEKLEMVGLPDAIDLMPSDLSGGMQKRVAFARAIATNPEILLYDEPTTGLDPITSTVIEELINKLNRELKITTIVVTHQISTIYNTADRIMMMHQGKFISAGTPAEAKKSKNPVIHNFLNGIVADERKNIV